MKKNHSFFNTFKINNLNFVKIIGLFLLSIWSIVLSGQELIMSDKVPVHNDNSSLLIGKIDSTVLVLRERNEGYLVKGFNHDLEEVLDKKIEGLPKKGKILKVIRGKKDFTCFFRHSLKGKTLLTAVKLNAQADTLQSVFIKEIEIKYGSYLKFYVSEDRNKILIFDGEATQYIYGTTFDISKMNIQWNQVFNINSFNLERDFLEAVITNQGNAFFILERDNKKSKRNTTRFEVVSYEAISAKKSTYDLSLKGRMWFDVAFSFDNLNKKLLAVGLYTNKKYGETNGTFLLSVSNENPEKYQLTFHEFDTRFITTVLGKEPKSEVGFGDISIQEIVHRRDGGVLMIAERNKKYSRKTTSSGGFYGQESLPVFRIDYYFNDIMLISINPDGQLHWRQLLRKRQYSQDDGGEYSSYFLLKSKNNLRFIFNEEIKSDANVNEYIVLADGRIKRKSLFNVEEHRLAIQLRKGIQIAHNQFIVPSERKGDLKIVKLVY